LTLPLIVQRQLKNFLNFFPEQKYLLPVVTAAIDFIGTFSLSQLFSSKTVANLFLHDEKNINRHNCLKMSRSLSFAAVEFSKNVNLTTYDLTIHAYNARRGEHT
jgi:hypothetical protein